MIRRRTNDPSENDHPMVGRHDDPGRLGLQAAMGPPVSTAAAAYANPGRGSYQPLRCAPRRLRLHVLALSELIGVTLVPRMPARAGRSTPSGTPRPRGTRTGRCRSSTRVAKQLPSPRKGTCGSKREASPLGFSACLAGGEHRHARGERSHACGRRGAVRVWGSSGAALPASIAAHYSGLVEVPWTPGDRADANTALRVGACRKPARAPRHAHACCLRRGAALAVTGALLASWLQPIAVVVQLQTSRGGTPVSKPAQAELSRTPSGKSTPTAEAESDGANGATRTESRLRWRFPHRRRRPHRRLPLLGTCRSDAKYDRYLHSQGWEGQKAAKLGGHHTDRRTSCLCYRHRDVSADATLGRSTCRAPGGAARARADVPCAGGRLPLLPDGGAQLPTVLGLPAAALSAARLRRQAVRARDRRLGLGLGLGLRVKPNPNQV